MIEIDLLFNAMCKTNSLSTQICIFIQRQEPQTILHITYS